MNAQGGVVNARRPSELLRFVASGSIGFKTFSLPFSIMLSPNNTNVTTPSLPQERNAWKFIQNPMNAIGFAPKFKWGQIFLGTHIPKHSTYTAGDLQIFGLGFDINPYKKLHIAFHGGNSQIAIAQNLNTNIPGAYARRIMSGKVAWGTTDSTNLYVAFMKSFDAVSSVPDTLELVRPSENFVMSAGGKWIIKQGYFIEGEFARSGYTDNTLEGEFSSSKEKILSRLMDINATSSIGTAVKAMFVKQGKVVSFRVYGDYLTEGFRTLGFPFLQPDQMNLKFEPRANLLQGKLNLSGSIGRRVNNISGLKSAKTIQLIGALNVNAQITEKLSVSASYSNFGLRNTLRNDTLRVENLAQSINFSPVYVYPTDTKMHTFTFTYSIEIFDDFNLVSGKENSNNSKNIMLSYVLGWKKRPLTLDFTLNRFQNDLSVGKLQMDNATAGIKYQYFKKKMTTGLKATFMSNKTDENTPATQVLGGIIHSYKVAKKITFNFNGSINLYKYGSEKPNVRFRETLIRTSLLYTLK
ncbi:MAG: hypothetical protein OHK0038_08860 [Flammeovirgaceae bacterium]